MLDPTPLYDAIDPDEPIDEAMFITTLIDGIERGDVYPWRLYDSGDKERKLSHVAYEALGKVLKRLNRSDLCYRKYQRNDLMNKVDDGKRRFHEIEYERMQEEKEAKKRGDGGLNEAVECVRTVKGRGQVRFLVGESSKAHKKAETSSDSESSSVYETESESDSEEGSQKGDLGLRREVDIIDEFEREQFKGWKPSEPIVISDDEGERRQQEEGVEVGEDMVEVAERSVRGRGKVPVSHVHPVGEVAGHPVVEVEEGRRVVVCGLLFDPSGYHQMTKKRKARKDPTLPPLPPRRSLRRRVVKSEAVEDGGSPQLVESVTMVLCL